ncbi:MAG: HlyD family efflux transporter periplasmic adaptor subunit [Tannerellaceae bacterium]|jgi:HlyD family secretion protein|nr:HlyD family efflux transporter periplasmic adaptor subunit [Tannerellaceae bacterium]
MKIMHTNIVRFAALAVLCFTSCNRNAFRYDASGVFEATEIIVSAEGTGKIEELNLTEGDVPAKGQYVGYIDTTQLYLKKLQLEATAQALLTRRVDIPVQIAAAKEQIAKAESDKRRIDNLFASDAATQKQVDDAASLLTVLRNNLAALQNQLSVSVNGINQESRAIELQIAQIDDQLAKNRIINPLEGTVLNKYSEAKEMATVGKPLYKIADTKHLFLRAYVIAPQLAEVKVGQSATVYIHISGNDPKTYQGAVAWVSDKAEFTPKTIQTQDERQNLVYAVKIKVENIDGLIKIGMYGDVDFN